MNDISIPRKTLATKANIKISPSALAMSQRWGSLWFGPLQYAQAFSARSPLPGRFFPVTRPSPQLSLDIHPPGGLP